MFVSKEVMQMRAGQQQSWNNIPILTPRGVGVRRSWGGMLQDVGLSGEVPKRVRVKGSRLVIGSLAGFCAGGRRQEARG